MGTKIVQCLLERKDGSKIDVFGKVYHFKPNELGHHVAEVNEEKAFDRFTKEIPEAYCEYDPDKVSDNLEKAAKSLSKKKWSDDAHRRKNTSTGRPAEGPVDDVSDEIDGITVEGKTPEELAKEAAEKTNENLFDDPYRGTSNGELKSRIENMTGQRVHHATGREKLVGTLIELEIMEAEKKETFAVNLAAKNEADAKKNAEDAARNEAATKKNAEDAAKNAAAVNEFPR